MQILAVSSRGPPDRSTRAQSTSHARGIGMRCADRSNDSGEDGEDNGEFHLYKEGGSQKTKPAKVGES